MIHTSAQRSLPPCRGPGYPSSPGTSQTWLSLPSPVAGGGSFSIDLVWLDVSVQAQVQVHQVYSIIVNIQVHNYIYFISMVKVCRDKSHQQT